MKLFFAIDIAIVKVCYSVKFSNKFSNKFLKQLKSINYKNNFIFFNSTCNPFTTTIVYTNRSLIQYQKQLQRQ